MAHRVHFNFEQGPDGTIAFGSTWVGGCDRQNLTQLDKFCLNVLKYLESEACSKSFEKVNDQEVLPSTR